MNHKLLINATALIRSKHNKPNFHPSSNNDLDKRQEELFYQILYICPIYAQANNAAKRNFLEKAFGIGHAPPSETS